jgi:hypothetical protein
LWFEAGPSSPAQKRKTLSQKYPTQKKAAVAQVVEYLPSKHEALNSNLSIVIIIIIIIISLSLGW